MLTDIESLSNYDVNVSLQHGVNKNGVRFWEGWKVVVFRYEDEITPKLVIRAEGLESFEQACELARVSICASERQIRLNRIFGER